MRHRWMTAFHLDRPSLAADPIADHPRGVHGTGSRPEKVLSRTESQLPGTRS